MDTLISTAVGLLAAEALCKKRNTTLHQTSSHSSSTSSSSSSKTHHRHHPRRRRTLSASSSETQTSSSTLEASLSSVSSTSSSSDSESDSDSSSGSEDFVVPPLLPPRRLTHQNLHLHDTSSRALAPAASRQLHSPSTSVSDTTISSSSSSSSSSSASSSSSEELTTHHHHHHHQHSRTQLLAPSPLHARLSSLLPALRASNEELEREREAGVLKERDVEHRADEDGREEDGYIEMDLGLGVLEEKQQRMGDEGPIQEVRVKRERSMDRVSAVVKGEGEGDVLGRLLGLERGGMTPEARERKRRRVGIEVL